MDRNSKGPNDTEWSSQHLWLREAEIMKGLGWGEEKIQSVGVWRKEIKQKGMDGVLV